MLNASHCFYTCCGTTSAMGGGTDIQILLCDLASVAYYIVDPRTFVITKRVNGGEEARTHCIVSGNTFGETVSSRRCYRPN